MDKNEIKGKMDDIKGRVKRQAGEWTGDQDLQTEGTADQAKGKAQNMFGKVKDKAKDLKDDLSNRDRNRDEEAA